MEYETRPVSADLLREAEPVVLPQHATWSDVWAAYLQERANNERLNCQLEAIAEHLSPACQTLLGMLADPARQIQQ
ncbi:MAG: hypothetical protein ACRESC_03300 [Gammaproteobacteria bacterium]